MKNNVSGIYKITSNTSGKSYIGLAKNINNRWKQHKNFEMENGKHLYFAFNEYGIEDFTFEVIKECPVNEMGKWERKYIKEYDSYKNGYNSSAGGEGASSKTLSDKYDLSYTFSVLDGLTYETFDFELTKIQKLDFKFLKITNKKERVIEKLKLKNKQLKIEKKKIKYRNKLNKTQIKINGFQTTINETKERNSNKYNDRVSPLEIHESYSFTEYDIAVNHEVFNDVVFKVVEWNRYQRNNIKYKEANIMPVSGQMILKNRFITFNAQGHKNIKMNIEEIEKITITAYDSGYSVEFNNAEEQFNSISGRWQSSDVVVYPTFNTLHFNYSSEVFGFIGVFRKLMGR